jgi:mRNA interferase RelE/StbE
VGEGEKGAWPSVKPLDIEFRPRAKKFLEGLDKRSQERTYAAIEILRFDPIPKSALRLTSSTNYRIRVGDYRIIYSFNGRNLVVCIILIGHRRDIYRK